MRGAALSHGEASSRDCKLKLRIKYPPGPWPFSDYSSKELQSPTSVLEVYVSRTYPVTGSNWFSSSVLSADPSRTSFVSPCRPITAQTPARLEPAHTCGIQLATLLDRELQREPQVRHHNGNTLLGLGLRLRRPLEGYDEFCCVASCNTYQRIHHEQPLAV